jgi:hypothetical protein
MGVSQRFSLHAEQLHTTPAYLPCHCGQIHFGQRLSPPQEFISIDCSICRCAVRFDTRHVGQRPSLRRVLMSSNMPCPVLELDPIQAELDIRPGVLLNGKRTWRITPTGPRLRVRDAMVAVFDVQRNLLHLGHYTRDRLVRGVFLHQESGFVQYRSRRSVITYERGLVEGPLMPGFTTESAVAIVHRGYRKWQRRLVRRVVSPALVRRRTRVSLHPNEGH